MNIDYRDLLKRYMRHAEAIEGTTFIASLRQTSVGLSFTDEEIAELEALEDEAMAEHERAIAEWHAAKAGKAQAVSSDRNEGVKTTGPSATITGLP